MSKLKNINLANPHIFGAVLLATAVTYGLNPSPVRSASGEIQLEQIATKKKDRSLPTNNSSSITSASAEKPSKTNLLLAQTAESNNIDDNPEQSNNRFLRMISLGFLLLFFVPLGIFYPLFLFYRMLLTKPEKSGDVTDEHKSEATDSAASSDYASATAQDINKATVSKLQIAFIPPARELRKELSRVSSNAHKQAEDNIVELMHQAIDILVEQGHWTHVSHSSQTFSLDRIKPEFDLISNYERHKFSQEESDLITYNRNVSSVDGYERNYSYVVVTLILCTSHTAPLFQTISTKEQLVNELTKLKTIEENAVIKFELLWNPQQEDVYISNDQLLIEYDEMTRLL